MKKIWLLNLITFLSAFLLFQIELIIAKIFLPNYGGSYLVWGACIVFFQAVLLLGYLLTHLGTHKLGISRYKTFHLVLISLPLLFFPGRGLDIHFSQTDLPLVIDVFLRLLVTIGPVFFVLSTVSLYTQSWLAGSPLAQKNDPYVLYAWSNIGSFLALLSYPFVFEIYLRLSEQVNIWRGAYLVFIILNLIAYFLIGTSQAKEKGEKIKTAIEAGQWQWFFFGMAGVIMFLAVNNIMTIEIAPIPLLWIIPLAIYLLTFVLNFKKNPWCPAWIGKNVSLILGSGVLLMFFSSKRPLPVLPELVLFSGFLFLVCMYCQGQLYRLKPKDDRNLTRFYVIVSLGSFVGGLVTTWVVPIVSDTLIEFWLGLSVIALATISMEPNLRIDARSARFTIYFLVFSMLWPIVFTKYHLLGNLLLIVFVLTVFKEFEKKKSCLFIALTACLTLAPLIDMLYSNNLYIYKKRNYYGLYRIFDDHGIRVLMHGTTLHGAQYLDERISPVPTTYFGLKSPIGEMMVSKDFQFHKIGVIGLGVGTLATYTKHDQVLDFYELDPDIYHIATEYFTFVNHSAGPVHVIFGDARLSLTQRPEAKYDLIVIDAFGGDAIPVHLLTREGIEVDRQHLNENGLLMFHISNRYIRLGPILGNAARDAGAYACYKINNDRKHFGTTSQWLMVTWDKKNFDLAVERFQWHRVDDNLIKQFGIWTDEYSNITPLIKVGALVQSFKTFVPLRW